MLTQATVLFLILYPILIYTCNPLKERCLVSNQALGTDMEGFNFNYFKTQGDVQAIPGPEQKVKMTLNERFQNPMIESNFFILYGKVECDIKASPGLGIISSFYLQSDDLDEIDIAEVFGGNPFQFQSNFFIKGNTTTWDRGGYHNIRNPVEFSNKYTVEWTPREIKWWCNDELVRVVPESNAYGIPKSPMAVKLSLWAGGDETNEPGTIRWAGGRSDYVGMPYIMEVKNLRVSDYSSGTVYTYGYEGEEWIGLRSDGDIGGRDTEIDREYPKVGAKPEPKGPESKEPESKEKAPKIPRQLNGTAPGSTSAGSIIYRLWEVFCMEMVIIMCWL